jgi:hypothetical protein
MAQVTQWPMIAEIGIWYHEDWIYDYETDERTQQVFLTGLDPDVPPRVAEEIRRLFETTSSPAERRAVMKAAGGFVYGNLPEDPDDFLRSWLFAMELASDR